LGRPVEDYRIDVHHFERIDEREDRRSTARDFGVGEPLGVGSKVPCRRVQNSPTWTSCERMRGW
jgi:hypothetical protein